MKSYHHIVTNFPKNEPLWKKIIGNLIFLIGVTRITFRKNSLTAADYKNAIQKLKKGDLVLLGQHKKISRYFISGPVTHSTLHIGNRKFIHAFADGVEKTTLKELIKDYDTLIILRPKISNENKKIIIRKTINYAKDQIGKPFNFFFEDSAEHFYCTQLVNDAYRQGGFDTGLANHKKNDHDIIGKITKLKTPLYPADFIKGNFELLYLSKSLKFDGQGNIILAKK